MNNPLESYLISIGFSLDENGYRKLQSIMSMAERTVVQHTSGMAKNVVEAQTAIVGSFAAVAGAIIGVADKAAMADQSYRLMGLRMMTTTESARKLDMISKALGVDLAQMVWDPELHQRATAMGDQIDKMSKMLGPGFAKDMRGIRDIRAEFSMLGIAVDFLGMKFASDLFRGLSGGKEIGDWLQEKVMWFEDHIPEMSAKLVEYAVPALKETWEIAKSLGLVLKAGAIAFTNFVGLFSGDASIQGATLDIEKLAKAVGHVAHGFEAVLGWITQAELLLAHFASGLSLAFSGKFDAALREFKDGLKELTTGSGAALGSLFGPEGTVIGGAIGAITEKAREGTLGNKAKEFVGQPESGVEHTEGPFGALPKQPVASNQPAPLSWNKEWEKPGDNSASGVLKFFAAKIYDQIGTYIDYFNRERGIDVEPLDQKKLREDRERALRKWATPPVQSAEVHPQTLNYKIDAIVQAIGKLEGYGKAGAIPTIANNPGDITAGKWAERHGATGFVHGKYQDYAKFPDAETGFAAAGALVSELVKKGATVQSLIERWAPPNAPGNSPESTQHYVDSLAKILGIAPNVPLKQFIEEQPEVAAQEQPKAVARGAAWHPGDDNNFRVAGDYVKPRGGDGEVAPFWFTQSPVWYGVAPAWLTKTPEVDSKEDIHVPSFYQDSQRPATASSQITNTQQTITVDVGGVYVTNSGASVDDVRRAVLDGVSGAMDKQILVDLAQIQPSY